MASGRAKRGANTAEVVTVDDGRMTLTLHRRIGSGAYSEVFTCSLHSRTAGKDPKVYACKRIQLFQDTDRCFLEAAIMMSIIHPFLATAHTIHLGGDDEMFIVQEKALGDLGRSGFSGGRGPTTATELSRLVAWSHQIVQGLGSLHRERIVHGDIKASNVLLYDHGCVALTDFSLATHLFDGADDGRTRLVISTVTHRAPEVHAVCHADDRARRRGTTGVAVNDVPPWGFPADVWSLGCTLYELAHGRTLFEYGAEGDAGVWREVCRWASSDDRDMNPWGAQIFPAWLLPPTGAEGPTKSRFRRLADRFPGNRSAELLDDLIGQCLTVDPSRRITLRDLLLHPLFAGRDLSRYDFVGMSEVDMSAEKEQMVESIFRSFMPRSSMNLTPTKSDNGEMVRDGVPLYDRALDEVRQREGGLEIYRTVNQWARSIVRRCVTLVEHHGATIVCQAAWRLACRMCVLPVEKYQTRDDPVRRMEHTISALLRFRFLEGEEKRHRRRR